MSEQTALTKKELSSVRSRRRGLDELAEIRAYARHAGVDVETATIEELLQGYARTMEDLQFKRVEFGLNAKKARDLEGLKLFPATDPQPSGAGDVPPVQVSIPPETLVAVANEIEKALATRRDRDRGILIELPEEMTITEAET